MEIRTLKYAEDEIGKETRPDRNPDLKMKLMFILPRLLGVLLHRLQH